MIISIVGPCDALVVCEAVIVYEHWHLSRIEISLDLMALLPFEIPFQLQLLTRRSFKKPGLENVRKRGESFERKRGFGGEL